MCEYHVYNPTHFSVSFSGIVLHLQISHPSSIVLNRVEMSVIGINHVKLC